MVRQKVRFIIVHFEFEDSTSMSSSASTNSNTNYKEEEPINASDIYQAMRECISSSFGSIGIGATLDARVLYFDDQTQLALVKTSRDASNIIKAILTFMTHIKKILTCTSIVSVHGSARTAKFHMIREIRKYHEFLIWKALEPYFPETTSSVEGAMDITKEVRQSMKRERRELRRKKQDLFDELNEKNENRIREQIASIQNLD